MPANVNLLKTRAECDEALASLTREKASYDRSEYNDTYADNAAAYTASTNAKKLAKAEADVVRYTADVARTDISATELNAAKRSLIDAKARREKLQLSDPAATGPAAYLGEVNDDQTDKQLEVLQGAIDDVTAHKDTLSA
ncbi:hypothetical protein Q5H93_19770 [Hymenobacter sp. ASUV-10]|uniref:Uncharacterized protein n=1 Tax=Hymenobacter aranciens TaxID=3063996 RepID=A0ABT9BFE3_9BACT|nr:hypothetical protein [Hymenobacter sp. ASUV-10]MDO7876994.1 hypothetical protein [Hymenobacter sp. ASUV-10]